jgi:hypothetical protein
MFVHENDAVRIAVVRDAETRSDLEHAGAHPFRVLAAAVEVDVVPVRFVV